jgi:hypothetical protein
MAWPIAGVTWIIFAGERIWDDVQVLLHGERDAVMGGNVIGPGDAAWMLFGGFFAMLALRVPSRSRSAWPACRRCCSRTGCGR